MKQLKDIAKKQKKDTYSLSFTAFVIGAMTVTQALLIVSIVMLIFLEEKPFSDVISQLAALLVVFIVRGIFSYIHGKIGIGMASKAKKQFRESLLTHYSHNPIQTSIKGQSGKRVTLVTDVVDEIDPYFSKYYPQRILSSIAALILLAAVFWQNWLSGLIMLVTAPLIPIFMIIIGKKTEKKALQQLDNLTALAGKFLDSLQGLITLKLFGKGREEAAAIKQSSVDYRTATMDVLKFAFLSSLVLELISMLGIALIALEVGLRLVVYQNISFFAAFFVLAIAPEFYKTLKDVGSAFHAGKGSIAAAKKIVEELAESDQTITWGNERLSQIAGPPSIGLNNLSFTYGEDHFSLQGIQATFEPYSQIAIVGASGSGKTSLLHLIAGMYAPSTGEVLINKQSLFTYDEGEWFDKLIYISQDPYIFSGTIKDNILIACPGKNISEEALNYAIEKAGLTELIDQLEDGANTVIGEGGRGLSGGEKQRIALARAFLKRPSIILFDEPTVGLDLYTESILQQSIQELAQNATIITVAHRLHTIKQADCILYLEKGTLIGKGTHEELMENTEDYLTMLKEQQGGMAG
ncbi:thiol reductant ABC exporter subunit CydD [Aquibacillus koreensis]|uniref:Thiol reductant ABC exporter subunit CydD n=1 Tax=Aquibacillus koreensis TaxID=279446 RepID=A0A9X3WH82_9BACI|nr:thiol reductant ABC exporter subunit CydD [Aquibacillus koreensis]MCT2534700.1 thiol reductant ABC exporter subunit CydD [Aquibacillus koreensis]MDC3419690.1 thiol reductant ABC exporter subunit CydD [Aquibacillus koreensis]